MKELVVALIIEFTLRGPCGIDRVGAVLRRVGLDGYVGTSQGALSRVATSVEQALGEFGDQEEARLAPGMPEQMITVCPDEHFHGGLTLMAMEPVSGYHVLEAQAEKRDEATWTAKLTQRLVGWKVRVVQVTSDEAKGLKALAHHGLAAHHSPDLFHGQRELAKALNLPLLRQLKPAEGQLKVAGDALARRIAQKAAYWQRPRWPGRPPAFDARIAQAETDLRAAQAGLDAAAGRRQEARQAIRQMARVYHPYELDTATPQPKEAVAQLLQDVFATIDRVANEAHLATASRERIDKARRLVPSMLDTIAFFWEAVSTAFTPLALPPEAFAAVQASLLPGLYLQRAAKRARRAADRHAIRLTSDQLLARARAPDGPLALLDPSLLARVELTALACADLFQRSSSCVEGRNGHQALCVHALHRLSTRKRKALTVVANFVVRHSDGSTAAEPFFGQSQRDAFTTILDFLPDLPKPRRSRSALAALA